MTVDICICATSETYNHDSMCPEYLLPCPAEAMLERRLVATYYVGCLRTGSGARKSGIGSNLSQKKNIDGFLRQVHVLLSSVSS